MARCWRPSPRRTDPAWGYWSCISPRTVADRTRNPQRARGVRDLGFDGDRARHDAIAGRGLRAALPEGGHVGPPHRDRHPSVAARETAPREHGAVRPRRGDGPGLHRPRRLQDGQRRPLARGRRPCAANAGPAHRDRGACTRHGRAVGRRRVPGPAPPAVRRARGARGRAADPGGPGGADHRPRQPRQGDGKHRHLVLDSSRAGRGRGAGPQGRCRDVRGEATRDQPLRRLRRLRRGRLTSAARPGPALAGRDRAARRGALSAHRPRVRPDRWSESRHFFGCATTTP